MPNQTDNDLKRDRELFVREIAFELIIGILASGVIGGIYVLSQSMAAAEQWISDINTYILAVAGVFVPAYVLSKWKTWQDFRAIYVTKMFRNISERNPDLASFAKARAISHLNILANHFNDLQGSAGIPWNTAERLNTAADLFDSRTSIKSYWATSIDPPYEASCAEARFFFRQSEKLKGADVRRLLAHPMSKLIEGLDSSDSRVNVKDFIRLHSREKFSLRYWPGEPSGLRRIIEEYLPSNLSSEPLVDFGIIDGDIVFGQMLRQGDTLRASGNGRITTEPHLVETYRKAFESLWNHLKHQSFPAEQLEAWLWAMENREDARSFASGLVGIPFFNSVVDSISNSSNLYAIDIASDMNLWCTKHEYLKFKDATIEAAEKFPSGRHERVYVLYNFLENGSAARLFLDQVIRPQLAAGVHISFISPCALIDHELAAMDFICDGGQWGFYLMPSDDFTREAVSAARNEILPIHISKFMSLFDAVHQCSCELKMSVSSLTDLNGDNVLAFLCGRRTN